MVGAALLDFKFRRLHGAQEVRNALRFLPGGDLHLWLSASRARLLKQQVYVFLQSVRKAVRLQVHESSPFLRLVEVPGEEGRFFAGPARLQPPQQLQVELRLLQADRLRVNDRVRNAALLVQCYISRPSEGAASIQTSGQERRGEKAHHRQSCAGAGESSPAPEA